jgi:hypothetical protein
MSGTSTQELPEVAQISEDAIARWSGFEADEQLVLPVTRQMLDDLMLALRNSAFASLDLGSAVQTLHAGDHENANEHFVSYQSRSRHALSGINRFIAAVMQGAQRKSGSDAEGRS